MKTSKLRDITAVLAKIMEVIAFVAEGLLAIGLIAILALRGEIKRGFVDGFNNGSLNLSAFGSGANNITTDNLIPILSAILIGGMVILALSGFLFRNINLIFKNTNLESPFALSNVKLVKQIGYIAVAIPFCKCIANFVMTFIAEDVSLGFEISELIFGLVILCLAQYFAYGASLEKDVNGLL